MDRLYESGEERPKKWVTSQTDPNVEFVYNPQSPKEEQVFNDSDLTGIIDKIYELKYDTFTSDNHKFNVLLEWLEDRF